MWPAAAAAAAAAAASPRPGIDIVMVARVAGLQLQQHSSSFISDQSSALIGRCLVSAAHLHLHLHSLLTGQLQHTAQAPDNAMSNGKIAEY